MPLNKLWAEYKRVTKPSAAIVLTAQCPFDKVLGASNLDMLRYEWLWEKSRATGHLNSKHQPMKKHENVLVFYRKQPVYNPQGLAKKAVPTVRKGGDNGTNYGLSNKDALQEYENFPTSILSFASQGKNVHPTQKPAALFEYLIKTYTNEGDTVLDNCAGSGTTGVACVNTNRKYILMEKEEKYIEIIEARLRALGELV